MITLTVTNGQKSVVVRDDSTRATTSVTTPKSMEVAHMMRNTVGAEGANSQTLREEPMFLKYPLQGQGWFKKLVIGGAIEFVPVVGWLAGLGYLQRVAANTIREERETPEWEDFGQLIREGFRELVAVLAYAAFAIALVFASGVASLVVGPVVAIVGAIMTFLLAVVGPFALVHMAYQGRLSAAFEFKTILRGSCRAGYLIALFKGFLAALVGAGMLFSLFFIVGMIGLGAGVGSFLSGGGLDAFASGFSWFLIVLLFASVVIGFYVGVASQRAFGQHYRQWVAEEGSQVPASMTTGVRG